MVSKTTAKFIKSLQLKKYRKQEQCFLVEGAKSVLEVLQSDFEVMLLVATQPFLDVYSLGGKLEVHVATAQQLSSLGTFKSNDAALAVVKMKEQEPFSFEQQEWCIALDDVNDPGNMGSILRIADWYGIYKVLASEQTADFYNPKTIAASKGSFCRVQAYYTSLKEVLTQYPQPVYGAFMEGEDIHKVQFGRGGMLVLGNEANGISLAISSLITKKITIPRYGKAESLNVAMATAVICDNIKRSQK
ncbi:RNA methyltransferase, TrmH family [Fulvivirga imtechensis AK7]|uniref:RNA methyltransferase, TrmH family n=1 Tax=Fulvivirga imtechensis AK7 TaxID=1237149 RepID=L8JPZ1_9BACT|nr:RNA methyltransferase [Fulvivirga imtechensis]ELR70910.1 RNA methyltransferase, TrmH family [Fulvivirga imtechensis AK7]